MIDYLGFLLCLLLVWVTIQYLLAHTPLRSTGKAPPPPPPGPVSIPIFGNLFNLGSKPHVSLAKLANIHGPVMALQLGRVPTVVISSASTAKEALQKHDHLFSDRFVKDVFYALNHHKFSLVWLPVSAPWRNLRKICNTHVFSVARLDATHELRRKKVEDLLSYVRRKGQVGEAVVIGQVAFTTTLNLLSSTIFSMDLGDPDSDTANKFKEIVRKIMEEAGKPNFADYFPSLKWVDPQGFRRRMEVMLSKLMDFFSGIIDQRLQGKRPSGAFEGSDVLDALLGINKDKTEELDRSYLLHLLLVLFVAGIDTTASALEWAMAELLHNPDKLHTAKAELQDIIGKGNTIEETDVARLPYLQAVVKETLRLHPSAPLVPRKANTNAELAGFTVPKNAQVLVNVWAMGRDPTVWKEPTKFEPERFMGSEIDVKGRDFELIPFGSGRRICPGMPMAIRMVTLMVGSLIHSFDWKLEGGMKPEEMNMKEKFGFTLEKAQPLKSIPVPV